MEGGWSEDEKFSGKFRFSFDGEKFMVDGKESVLVSWNGSQLTAVVPSASDHAGSIWSYAVNLDIEEIVGAQVNSYRAIGTGIKTRSVSFDCKFDYSA